MVTVPVAVTNQDHHKLTRWQQTRRVINQTGRNQTGRIQQADRRAGRGRTVQEDLDAGLPQPPDL